MADDLKTQMATRKSVHPTDMRKKSLFKMVDKGARSRASPAKEICPQSHIDAPRVSDGSGEINEGEFSALYDVMRQQTEDDVKEKLEAERKVANASRRVKYLACLAFTLVLFLGVPELSRAHMKRAHEGAQSGLGSASMRAGAHR